MPKTGDSNPYVSPSIADQPVRKTAPTVIAVALAILALVWIGGYIVQMGRFQISLFETVLLLMVTVSCIVGSVISKQRWLLGLPLFFAIAAACSPADPVSTLAFAVPSCCIYAIAFLISTRQHASG